MTQACGPDISFHDNDPETPQGIDFEKMKPVAEFVIIRAGQNLWFDRDFKYNWSEAKKAGIPRGCYWFYDSRVAPKQQAELWVATLNGDLGELPLFLDLEENYGGQYAGWQSWYDCLERLKQLVGKKEIGIYTGYFYWNAHAPSETKQAQNREYFHQYPLWVANYKVTAPRIPLPWKDSEWLFWQYTDHGDGKQYGVESLNIDLNYFNGDKPAFEKRFQLTGNHTLYQLDFNLYKTPAQDAAITGYLQHNDKVEKLTMSDDGLWTEVARTDGLTGWLSNDPLRKVDSPIPPPPSPPPSAENKWYKVTALALNVREGPSTSYNIIGTLKNNEVVQGLESTSDGGWKKILRVSDNLTGWSSSSYLVEVDAPAPPPPKPAIAWLKVNTTNLNVREGPATSYNQIGTFHKDEILFSTEWTADKKWYKVRRFDGLLGWCSADLLIYLGDAAPAEVWQRVFDDVIYHRKELTSPRKIVAHVIAVDTHAEEIQFLVTPPSHPNGLLCARKTSQFLVEFKAQVAVNGDGFKYVNRVDYPTLTCQNGGELVKVNSFAVSKGKTYSERKNKSDPFLSFNQRNEVAFNASTGNLYNALAGYPMLVEKGGPVTGLESKTIEPRTIIGANKNGRWVYLVVFDGRQDGYSEGISLPEAADFLISIGAYQALNMDGGGSSTIVIEDPQGKPFVLNSPIEGGIPGNEAAVANHLGVFAKK